MNTEEMIEAVVGGANPKDVMEAKKPTMKQLRDMHREKARHHEAEAEKAKAAGNQKATLAHWKAAARHKRAAGTRMSRSAIGSLAASKTGYEKNAADAEQASKEADALS